MAEGSFNQNDNVQSLTARNPEKLTELIRQIKVPMTILGFTGVPGLHTCYFRSAFKITVVKQDARVEGRING